MAYIRVPPPPGWVYELSLHKIFVCIHMVVRPSSCGTSSEGHYTSFTTKCRSYVLPAVNFETKFREEGEITPKSREEGDLPSYTSPLQKAIGLKVLKREIK